MSDNYIAESKKLWHSTETQAPSLEELNLGCLQRIAAACEAMASNYDVLQRERNYYQKRTEEEIKANRELRLKNSALRGVITKLKRK